jgi:soluble lytic murein transglycosylase-like protein
VRRLLTGVALAAALLAHTAARAEVWGYVDDRGVGHFATERVDERYQLFFRGGESFDTSTGLKGPQPARPAGLPGAPAKLVAFFEVSPAFRQVKHHLRAASNFHGIDYELLQAVIAAESGFDGNAVSPKGAIGLMQIMPATAERYGVTGDRRVPIEKKLTDPRTNVDTGARYLADLIRMFGQLDLALAAYNAGEGAVQRAGNRIPNYRETQNYVKTVMALYTTLKPPNLRGRSPLRIRMEIGGVPVGGAIGRGNLPSGMTPGAGTGMGAGPAKVEAGPAGIAAAPAAAGSPALVE